MANFVSTTIGYSDPLKAQAIKALEARQKDMQAQIATAQAGGITPENTQTPIQGIGHLANQLGDSFRQGRIDSAAAEGRNELAGVIAQGPQGPDGNWSPQQLSVMARRSPELMEKFYTQQHDAKLAAAQDATSRRGQDLTLEGVKGGHTVTARGQDLTLEGVKGGHAVTREGHEVTREGQRLTADVAREGHGVQRDTAAGVQAGENFRLSQKIAADADEGNKGRVATSALQAERFSLEAGLERVKAAINEATQRREFAFKSGLTDQVAKYDQQLATLNADLKARESKLDRAHQDATLNTKIAADENQIRLRADLAQAEGDRQRAAARGLQKETQEAEERITRIKGDLAVGLEDIKARHAKEAQTQAEGATATNLNTKVAADKEIAAANADAARNDPTKVAAALKMQRELTQKQLLEHRLERASVALNHPEGIHTGATGRMYAEGTSWTGLGDKKKAERTILVDTAMDEVATGKMADILTGPSTNFELQKFIEMSNNPKVSMDERRTQFATLLKAVKKDREATATAVRRTGGDATDPNAAPPAAAPGGGPAAAAGGPPAAAAVEPPAAAAGGASARPAGDDASLLAAAKAAIAAGKDPTVIKQRLQSWGVKGGL